MSGVGTLCSRHIKQHVQKTQRWKGMVQWAIHHEDSVLGLIEDRTLAALGRYVYDLMCQLQCLDFILGAVQHLYWVLYRRLGTILAVRERPNWGTWVWGTWRVRISVRWPLESYSWEKCSLNRGSDSGNEWTLKLSRSVGKCYLLSPQRILSVDQVEIEGPK